MGLNTIELLFVTCISIEQALLLPLACFVSAPSAKYVIPLILQLFLKFCWHIACQFEIVQVLQLPAYQDLVMGQVLLLKLEILS